MNKKLMLFNTITCALLWLVIFAGFTDTINTAQPAGTDDPSEADDNMRRIQGGFQELLNVDHYFPLTGTAISDADAGEHRKILFHAPIASTPTVAADHGDLRIKDVSAKAELHWTDEDEQEVQITSVGKILSASLDMKDEDDMSSDSATHAATQQSIKAYADSIAPAPDADGNNGTGSYSLGNGLIIKYGRLNVSATSTGTLTFNVAFPTACFQAVAVLGEATGQNVDNWFVDNIIAASFDITNNAPAQKQFHWIAIGR